jgi:hypothetical protein
MATTEPETLAPTIEGLEGRLEEVRSVVSQLEAGSAPRLANMTERMAELLQQARDA